jgi:hypothetical protein
LLFSDCFLGSPQPLDVASIFLALRCRHNTNMLSVYVGSHGDHAHFERYFELICICAKFVQKQATQSRLSCLELHSHGFASVPNLHRLVQVKMNKMSFPEETNPIIAKVLKSALPGLNSQDIVFSFLQTFFQEKSHKRFFLAFLDSSRVLMAECNDEGFPSLFWIPTPDITDFPKSIVGPKQSNLWKDPHLPMALTAVDQEASHHKLYTESQDLKFQFLQFASQLLEAKFYTMSQREEIAQVSFPNIPIFVISIFVRSLLSIFLRCGSMIVAIFFIICARCFFVCYLLMNLPSLDTIIKTAEKRCSSA